LIGVLKEGSGQGISILKQMGVYSIWVVKMKSRPTPGIILELKPQAAVDLVNLRQIK